MTAYEPVIGLEVHAQLQTESKLFCGCSTAFGASPNAHTCPVCLALPGVLPVLNGKAVELAVRAGLALGCEVQERSQWSRKNYFYPDLPKGYQITQYAFPIALGGQVTFDVEGVEHRLRLTRIHMEEDAGKSVHDEAVAGARTLVDYNRAGTPLIEIVSEPELSSGAQAAAFLRTLRGILRAIGACDGNMEQGSLRCDANVSLRIKGTHELGTRTEIKNLNSFRFLQAAIEYEIERQREVLEDGGRVVQETRLWDTQKNVTRSMRSKEEAHDYRYFPEPDLPDLHLSRDFIDGVARELPELPSAMRDRFVGLGVSPQDAAVITEDVAVAQFFDRALGVHDNAKGIANWVVNELLRELKDHALEELKITPEALGELVSLIDGDVISGKIAKEIFGELLHQGGSPKDIVKARGLEQVADTSSIDAIVAEVVAAHPDIVAQYREGKTKVIGFLVGQVMKKSGGKASPKLVNERLQVKLNAGA